MAKKSKYVEVVVFVLVVLLRGVVGASSSSGYVNFTYNEFEESQESFFRMEGNSSSIVNGALQITPETLNEAMMDIHYNRSGRIFYPDPIRLWSNSNEKGAGKILNSFNTNFVINIYTASGWQTGHGLAFLIAPNVSIPISSHGQWLGLTNETSDGSEDNHIFAIEFDTAMQADIGDPDSNHIGIDINSVRSQKTVSLEEYNLSPPPPGANYSVWIQYNGTTKVMEVYMAGDKDPMPSQPIFNETIDLSQFLKQESYFGFAASTGQPQIELNCVLRWSLTIGGQETVDDKAKILAIGLGIGVPLAILLVVLVYYVRRKRRNSKGRLSRSEEISASDINIQGPLKWLPGMPREFRYKELKKATNNFDERMKLGEGGFGIVYRGVLHDSDSHNTITKDIAVKRFTRDSIKSKDDFLAELAIIHRLRHKHLVRLVGWCYEKGKLLLVYDLMPNGSLDKHLYEAAENDTLNWSRRMKILAGVASALHYLHNEYDQKVIHRDLKASNILLEADFNPRLGDFGLARALENERNSYAELGMGGIAGTMGYVAPECFHTGKATPESDVFGFGAVVLEVVCGKGPGTKIPHNQHLYSLVDWVWALHREGRILEAVDERLKNDLVEEEAERLLFLGLACSHPIDHERPKTETLVPIISGTLPTPRVPPFRPVFMWPSSNTSVMTESSLSTLTSTSQEFSRSKSANKLWRSSSNLPV